MTTKQDFNQKIAELQAQVDALPDDKPKPTGVIYDEPKIGDNTWILEPDGVVSYQVYSPAWIPEFTQGSLFYDEASAIHAGKVKAIRHRLAGFCAKAWRDAGAIIDWNDAKQDKNYLTWYNGAIEIQSFSSSYIDQGRFHLPTRDLSELNKAFTPDELKLAITGEL